MKAQSLPKLKAKLQIVFNEFIRLRDKDQPCISCGKYKPLQAGHYWSVRMSDGLRYDEDNVFGECALCNGFDPCHLIYYTENLKNRIGQERYDALKNVLKTIKRTVTNGHVLNYSKNLNTTNKK